MAVKDYSDLALGDLISLAGRTAVITGGAAGLGKAIAGRLAEAGATVVIGDIDEDKAQSTAASLGGAASGQHVAKHVDVSEHASIAALGDFALAQTDRLDIWVNNAGIFPSGKALDMPIDDWNRVLDVNLRGTFLGCREGALRMQDKGVIVNLASTNSFNTGVSAVHYVASKHGVVGVTKSMAVELADRGVRVLAVAPTMTETDGVARMRNRGAEVSDGLDSYARSLPLGRSGVPDDIARVVLFLVSDMSSFMTGSVVLVDGGDLAR